MAAVRDIGECADALPRIAPDPDRSHHFTINMGRLFAFTKIGQRQRGTCQSEVDKGDPCCRKGPRQQDTEDKGCEAQYCHYVTKLVFAEHIGEIRCKLGESVYVIQAHLARTPSPGVGVVPRCAA